MRPLLATQVLYPWQATIRTLLQTVLALGVASPLIVRAVVDADPALAGGALTVVLGVCAALARAMATPGVEVWLEEHVPWPAARPPAG